MWLLCAFAATAILYMMVSLPLTLPLQIRQGMEKLQGASPLPAGGGRALTRSGMTRILALWLSAICFSAYALLVTQFVAWKNSASGSFCHTASTLGIAFFLHLLN